MKKHHTQKWKLVLLSLSVLVISCNQSTKNSTNEKETIMNTESKLRDQLVGAWRMKAYVEIDEETGEKNYPFGTNPDGFIIYTTDGYMSAQIQKNGRKPFKDNDMFRGTSEEYIEEASGYLAYSGRFFVDEKEMKITHEMAVSLFPNWLGNQQKRIVRIENNVLNLETDGPLMFNGKMKVAKITWERATANF